jgi:2-hydroxychromene-2-carboxylate isomerase
MRTVLWAQARGGAGDAVAHAAFAAGFADGRDVADVGVLRDVAAGVGLPDDELEAGIGDPAIKAALRAATDAAIAAGVRGVPTLALPDGQLLFGDDRLEEAVSAPA